MGRKIIWSPAAIQQRKEIFEYWNLRNKSTTFSKKLRTEFQVSLNEIALMPGIGSFTEEAGVLRKIVREYLIFYHYDDSNVYVNAVWDSRRNPEQSPYNY